MKNNTPLTLILVCLCTLFSSLFAEESITKPLKTVGLGAPKSFAFSSDEKKLAVISGVEGVRIWDCESGELLQTLSDSANRLIGVTFSPDNKKLLAGSMDSCARLYSIETGELLRVFPKDNAHINRVTWSPTGKHFATATGPGGVTVWDAETGEKVNRFISSGWIRGVHFTPDGTKIFLCGNKKTAYLYDIITAEKVETFFADNSFKGSQISPDGTAIITIHEYASIAQLWDITNGQAPLYTFDLSGGIGRTAGFNHDGTEVVVSDSAGVTQFWSRESGDSLRISTCSSMVFLFGKEKMITYDNGGVTVRAMNTGEKKSSIEGYAGKIHSLSTQEKGTSIVVAKSTPGVNSINSKSGLLTKTCSIQKVVNHAQLSKSGKMLAYTTCDSTYGVWDMEADTALFTASYNSWPSTIVFSPDEKQVVVGAQNGRIYVYDARSGETIINMKYSLLSISGLAWTLDGKKIISADRSGNLFLWDVATGDTLYRAPAEGCAIDDMAISRDRSKVAVCGDSKVVFLFDVATGEILKTFEGHTNFVEAVAITPDGKYIVTGSMDNEIKLWSTATGECLRTYLKHNTSIYALAFASNGMSFYSGDSEGALYQWDMGEYISVLENRESASSDAPLQLKALNRSTLIFSNVPDNVRGKVSLFLSNGRKVQTLEYCGGTSQLSLKHSLASGRYFWKLEQEDKLMGRGRLMIR